MCDVIGPSVGATRIDQGRHMEQKSFHSTISLTHRLQLDERRITRIETAKNIKDIVILPTDKGCVTVVMDKKDYSHKMDSLFNDKHTYEPLKCNPTPALQRRLSGKLLDLKKKETIDIQLYYRLRCRVPQSAKLYGLPKLPIVSYCWSPTYQLSKHLTNILEPL